MKQIEFNLEVLKEGLLSISLTQDEQIKLDYDNNFFFIDDIFDPMPLDYVSYLVDKNIISKELESNIIALYEEINSSAGMVPSLNEKEFILDNVQLCNKWRAMAKNILYQLPNQRGHL